MLALVNVTMADAAIGCWDAKYRYVFWRPITAITAADDGNPDTVSDPDLHVVGRDAESSRIHLRAFLCERRHLQECSPRDTARTRRRRCNCEALMNGNPIPDRSFNSFLEVLTRFLSRASTEGSTSERREEGAAILDVKWPRM